MNNKRTSGKTRSINEQKKTETQSKIISEKRGEQILSRRGIDSSNVVQKNDQRIQYEAYIRSTFPNLRKEKIDEKIKSKSGFRIWKLQQTAPVLASYGDMSLLGKITSENNTGATTFKSEPLVQGPLGIEGSANLGQGRAGHTNVHTAIANVPGHVIARQRELRDNGTTDVIVETWATARTQMNPTAVSAQGRGTIGQSITIDMSSSIQSNYVEFISSNPQFFGCHVSPLNIPLRSKFKTSGGGFVYNYNTTNIFESIGAGTLFGIPNEELEYTRIREIISMTDWLTNMPLVKQSPMTQGRPQGNPEPPHTEHVLSILDALWYLDLFETVYVPLMKDYHAFMEAWYNANLWGQTPTSVNFLEFLTTIRYKGFNGDIEAFLQAIWPGANIMNIEGAWTKIHDFILEYLYANADSNYEKNDDSLICVRLNDRGDSQIVFNEQMAKDLAQRIWKKRLVLDDGLIDVIFGTELGREFKTKLMEKTWKRNIVASWRQRLDPTCIYITNKIHRGGQNLFGLATISNYRYRLPQTIKEIMFGHVSQVPQGEPVLTLSQQGTYLVPTNAMTVIVMESVSQLMTNFIRNASTGFKIDYDTFIRFCGFDIGSAEFFSKNPELNIRRSSRKGDHAEMMYQTIAYHAIDTYIKSNPVYINFLRNAFIILFYLYELQIPVELGVYLVSDKNTLTPEQLAVLEQNEEQLKTIYIEKEERRNIIISCLLSQFHILLCGFFLERAGGFSDQRDPLYSFSMDIGQKLNGLIASKRESSIISINNVQIRNENGSFTLQRVDFDINTVLQYLSNSLNPTTPDANTVRLFYPFYHYDYATCETFFGKDFDKILVTMADQMTGLNYGVNLIPSTVVEETVDSLSSGPNLKRTYSTETPIALGRLQELRQHYGNLGAFSPGAGGGAGGGFSPGAGSTTDGNDNLTTRQLFKKAIGFAGGSKTKKRKSRAFLSKRKNHTIRKHKPSHKRTTQNYRSK